MYEEEGVAVNPFVYDDEEDWLVDIAEDCLADKNEAEELYSETGGSASVSTKEKSEQCVERENKAKKR